MHSAGDAAPGPARAQTFSDWNDSQPETELNSKFYRQATNKIVGISDMKQPRSSPDSFNTEGPILISRLRVRAGLFQYDELDSAQDADGRKEITQSKRFAEEENSAGSGKHRHAQLNYGSSCGL